MKTNIQKLIPKARQAIHDVSIPIDNKVDSEYLGYISSFGAGIVQGGLLPAVIFFENSEGDRDKSKITQALRLMLERENNPTARPNGLSTLSDHILDTPGLRDSARFLKKITHYSVALKIALRTFEKNTTVSIPNP